MKTIPQGHLPVRTLVLIGMVILITAQAYAQNANARLTLTLRNATLKEFVKRIENSTGYSFIYGEEINISHKINLKVKDMPLHEILDLVFKDEPISYQFSERYILLQKKKKQKLILQLLLLIKNIFYRMMLIIKFILYLASNITLTTL